MHRRFQSRRSRASTALATACLAVSLLAPAAPAARIGVDDAVPLRPQLLLIHGGSFLFEDPFFEPLMSEPARAAGFDPHFLSYPLGSLPAAVATARSEARRIRDEHGRVFAYGASAGGTLAALLAGDGLASAAVAKAPPTDLLGWEWPLTAYGPDFYQRIGADPEARRRLSPLRRPVRRPLLVLQGARDRVVPLSMNEAFAARFRRVHLWAVPGGHATERVRPWLLEGAMRWLARTARTRAASAPARAGAR